MRWIKGLLMRWNWRASMAHLTAKASSSIVEYFLSAECSFLLRKVMGCSSSRTFCDRTAPKPVSDASLRTMKGCVKSGLMSTACPNSACHRALSALELWGPIVVFRGFVWSDDL